MKKNIEIFTLNGNTNYGNKLQNYALLKTIEKYNYSVFTYWEKKSSKGKIKDLIKRIFPMKKQYVRYNNFVKFTKKYLNVSNVKSSNNYRNIVGSDQVWNYSFGTFNDDMFLKFSPKNKNIAYAASFGLEEIHPQLTSVYDEGINNIGYLSVREDRGKELVQEVTGRSDVEVVVDPTMLLTTEEWNLVSKRPKMFKNKKYILNYFLGNLSKKRKEAIEKIAKENNCEIINILDKNDPFYECGPSEFLFLEKNAFLICTDSFHSSVFAILYNRPFVVFNREQDNITNMNSRIDTLINKFKLKDRYFNGNEITKQNLEHDYSNAYILLEKERKKGHQFLKNALNGDNYNEN